MNNKKPANRPVRHDPATHTSTTPFPIPQSMKRRNTDIDGYWDGQNGVKFIPRIVKVFDGRIEKFKPSVLIIGELLAPCGATVKDDEGEQTETTLEPGQTVGVWGKPGMRDLRNGSRNVPTIIIPTGEREIGKGNPMKTYDVYFEDGGSKLAIDEDERDKSASVPCFLEPRGRQQAPRYNPRPEAADDGDDDDDSEPQNPMPTGPDGKPLF